MKQIKLVLLVVIFCTLSSFKSYSQAYCSSSSPGNHSSCYSNSSSGYEFASDEWAFSCPTGNMHYYAEASTDGTQYASATASVWGDLPTVSVTVTQQTPNHYAIVHNNVSNLNPNQTYYMGGTVTTQNGAYAYASILSW